MITNISLAIITFFVIRTYFKYNETRDIKSDIKSDTKSDTKNDTESDVKNEIEHKKKEADSIDINDKKTSTICEIDRQINDEVNDVDNMNTINKIYDTDESILCELQKLALIKCVTITKTNHVKSFDDTLKLFTKYNLSQEDFMDVCDYIKNIDPIIHIGRFYGNINWLINETKIINGIQLKNTYNGDIDSRIGWETRLFDNGYPSDCSPNLRVKYGCLNIASKKVGCNVAFDYGRSYIILKPELKYRITFIYGDSSYSGPQLCTFDNFSQFLLYLSPSILIKIVQIAKYYKGKLNSLPDIDEFNYIEMQIHGDLDIKRDL